MGGRRSEGIRLRTGVPRAAMRGGMGQWSRVWLLLGAASAFHVLVGGWAVVAALVAWCITGDQQNRLAQIPTWPPGWSWRCLG